jgi:hypothetical protein
VPALEGTADSLVQSQYRAPQFLQFNGGFSASTEKS